MTACKQDGSENGSYSGRKGHSDWMEGDQGVPLEGEGGLSGEVMFFLRSG